MDNNKITCQSGFTLLEVLIALLIFSVGILGVKTMQLTSIKGNSKANRITTASNVAVDQLETFLALDYSDPALDPSDHVDSDVDGVKEVSWNVAVTHSTNSAIDTKTIKIFVEPLGGGKMVSMVLVKADIE